MVSLKTVTFNFFYGNNFLTLDLVLQISKLEFSCRRGNLI